VAAVTPSSFMIERSAFAAVATCAVAAKVIAHAKADIQPDKKRFIPTPKEVIVDPSRERMRSRSEWDVPSAFARVA
jgi:hypothetical protein